MICFFYQEYLKKTNSHYSFYKLRYNYSQTLYQIQTRRYHNLRRYQAKVRLIYKKAKKIQCVNQTIFIKNIFKNPRFFF